SMNIDALALDQRQRVGQLTLNSPATFLNLPTVEISPIVLKKQFVIHRLCSATKRHKKHKTEEKDLCAFCAFLRLHFLRATAGLHDRLTEFARLTHGRLNRQHPQRRKRREGNTNIGTATGTINDRRRTNNISPRFANRVNRLAS